MTLEERIKEYYSEKDYNCSETLIHAANDQYNLGLDEESMKLMAGFGGGMFIGETCGALVGSIAALSKMVIEDRAHAELHNFRPLIQKATRNFKNELGSTACKEVKPVHHTKEKGCLNTCLLAGKALETTIQECNLLNEE